MTHPEKVERFNENHPVGSLVYYWPGARKGPGRLSKTRTEAQLLGGHTAVVWVDDYIGCMPLSSVEVIP